MRLKLVLKQIISNIITKLEYKFQIISYIFLKQLIIKEKIKIKLSSTHSF